MDKEKRKVGKFMRQIRRALCLFLFCCCLPSLTGCGKTSTQDLSAVPDAFAAQRSVCCTVEYTVGLDAVIDGVTYDDLEQSCTVDLQADLAGGGCQVWADDLSAGEDSIEVEAYGDSSGSYYRYNDTYLYDEMENAFLTLLRAPAILRPVSRITPPRRPPRSYTAPPAPSTPARKLPMTALSGGLDSPPPSPSPWRAASSTCCSASMRIPDCPPASGWITPIWRRWGSAFPTKTAANTPSPPSATRCCTRDMAQRFPSLSRRNSGRPPWRAGTPAGDAPENGDQAAGESGQAPSDEGPDSEAGTAEGNYLLYSSDHSYSCEITTPEFMALDQQEDNAVSFYYFFAENDMELVSYTLYEDYTGDDEAAYAESLPDLYREMEGIGEVHSDGIQSLTVGAHEVSYITLSFSLEQNGALYQIMDIYSWIEAPNGQDCLEVSITEYNGSGDGLLIDPETELELAYAAVLGWHEN